MITATNEDNMIMMARYPDDYFEFAIVDPEYGIDVDNNKKGNFVMTKHKSKGWDKKPPPSKYFKELFRVSKKQIIWGGNYFPLPLKKGWICWDKVNPLKGKFSDFELAWTSFLNCDRIYKQEWIGFGRKFVEKNPSIHPTQKPVKLYEWILMNYAKEGDKILDTHRGSASLDIACHNLGFDLVTCELDTDYFNDGNKRLKQHQQQQVMKF
jgi:site-specific DNA-methyltransferase (adenine-specific)